MHRTTIYARLRLGLLVSCCPLIVARLRDSSFHYNTCLSRPTPFRGSILRERAVAELRASPSVLIYSFSRFGRLVPPHLGQILPGQCLLGWAKSGIPQCRVDRDQVRSLWVLLGGRCCVQIYMKVSSPSKRKPRQRSPILPH